MNANDPFEDVAWCYSGYLCDTCDAELIELPDRDYAPASGWEEGIARYAKSSGWAVSWKPETNDWAVLCPACRP